MQASLAANADALQVTLLVKVGQVVFCTPRLDHNSETSFDFPSRPSTDVPPSGMKRDTNPSG